MSESAFYQRVRQEVERRGIKWKFLAEQIGEGYGNMQHALSGRRSGWPSSERILRKIRAYFGWQP